MKKSKLNETNTNTGNTAAKTASAPGGFNDSARIYIAISLLTILATGILIYILDYFVFALYNPDVTTPLAKIIPMTIVPPTDFMPEPVERLQFQLSLLCTPLFVLGTYTLFSGLKDTLQKKASLPAAINIGSIVVFLLYFVHLLTTKIPYTDDGTNATLFEKNLFSKIDPLIATTIYIVLTYLLIVYLKSEKGQSKNITNKIISWVCYLVVAVTVYDVFLCNIFYLPTQTWDRLLETNAVFYAITQVYVGKSLLVHLNAQYGLYPLLLLPVFKIIGLSSYKFGVVMATLNAATFVLLYLGIKKIIKQDIISLLVFLCVIFWQYWNLRVPLELTTRYYFQYSPIRTIFPSLVFFLFVSYQMAAQGGRRILLPLLAICASLAIIWNTDSGAPTYGATFIGLLYSQTGATSIKDWFKKSLKYIAWMVGTLTCTLLMLVFVTKIRSGLWPDFNHFLLYQGLYYGSGYYMLPMSAEHFWNLPVWIYLAAGTFCAYYLQKAKTAEANVSAFLFILGCGLFVYFQGRSYQTNLYFGMYPAIILAGMFCKKLLGRIQSTGTYKLKMHEMVVLFLFPFIFIVDGALSMLFYTPSIHSFAHENAFTEKDSANPTIKEKIAFMKSNLRDKDTVIILSLHNEAFLYAAGEYYNPVNISSSTELFTKADFNILVDSLRYSKYPIIYDASNPLNFDHTLTSRTLDTVINALAKNTRIEKMLPDSTMMLLRHGRNDTDKLTVDANTIYYNDYGDFNNFVPGRTKVVFPENFSIEMIISLRPDKSPRNAAVFGNISKNSQFKGLAVAQGGDNDKQFGLFLGNGTAWMTTALFTLEPGIRNRVLINVNKNVVNVVTNGKPGVPFSLPLPMINTEEPFIFNRMFPGTVHEVKIEKL